MKNYLFLFFCFISTITFAQTINDYKYIIVPMKFDFQSTANQYRISTNVKYYLENKGFTVFYDSDILPIDLAKDKCKALYVEVVKSKAFMATKLSIIIKNCQNKTLYTSLEGKSKEKEYELAYKEALKLALNSMNTLNYKYKDNQNAPVLDNELVENPEIISAESDYTLKKILNGYIITNPANPNFFLKLFKTSKPEIFIGQSNEENGLVTNLNNTYTFQYYKNNLLIAQSFIIKL